MLELLWEKKDHLDRLEPSAPSQAKPLDLALYEVSWHPGSSLSATKSRPAQVTQFQRLDGNLILLL